ncbi:MAG: S24 family peptidase [Candidatus Kapabacteria bacterium]|jgi:hypothetical protein|nr:S24 family peptidase [Candidatus Kapabacteria bacterium]
MLLSEFEKNLRNMNNPELIALAKNYAQREYLGYSFSSAKNELIFEECLMRDIKISFDGADEAVLFRSNVIFTDKADYIFFDKPPAEGLATVEMKFVKDEYVDYYNSSNVFNLNEKGLIQCRVSGDSMIGVGITNNSTLFVRPSDEIVPGRIAVVKVEGEMFVKRVMLDNDTIVLLSENPDFPPVRLDEDTDFSVVGIVRGIYERDLD